MQQEEFLEQLINEMKTVSEDFNHDEKTVKALVTSMMESKPVVQQDPHFKTQLANNLARHIARKKNPVPTPAVSQSRLARLIAYGLPGLTLCFVVWYTLPFGGENLATTFETNTTTFQVPLSVETGSSDVLTSGSVVDTGAQEIEIQTTSSNSNEVLSSNEGTTQNNSSVSVEQVQENTTSTSNPQQEEPVEHIPVQTTEPATNETSSSEQTILMKGGETTASTQEPTTSDSGNVTTTANPTLTQQDPQAVISEERKLFAEQLASLLSIKITLRQGDIVDCLSQSGALTCDLLANRSFDKEHKILLLDEIEKNLPSDLIDKMTMMQIRMILGL